MTRVPDLAVIEGRDTHENAALDRHVKLAVGIEASRDLERPVAGGPSRRASNVGAIARKLSRQDDPGNDSADRYPTVQLHRIRLGFRLGHEPARAVALADFRIEIDGSHRRGGRGRV